MAKNILIINGSPRKKGNSEILAEAFTRGAEAAGHTVALFDSAKDKVNGCIACNTCWSRGKPCSFDDGFDRLAPMLEKADALALCGPVYWFTFSAQLKSAIDKFYAFMVPQAERKLGPKETVLLMVAGDERMEVFDGAVTSYKNITGYLQWKDRGMLLVPNVNEKGDIVRTDALARAEKLGREL